MRHFKRLGGTAGSRSNDHPVPVHEGQQGLAIKARKKKVDDSRPTHTVIPDKC